jgi:hypothetical protein
MNIELKNRIPYHFSGKVWVYDGASTWHFVSLPKEISFEIRKLVGWQEEGWGRLKTQVKIGNSVWDTSIWFDSKLQTYLLPLKAEIRKKENVKIDQIIEILVLV